MVVTESRRVSKIHIWTFTNFPGFLWNQCHDKDETFFFFSKFSIIGQFSKKQRQKHLWHLYFRKFTNAGLKKAIDRKVSNTESKEIFNISGARFSRCNRGEGASLFRNWHSDFQNNFNSSRQEEKLEKLEGMVALESADAYIFYNAMIRDLNNHCIRYLDMLNTGRYDVKGGTTKLDRYRVNFCRNEIENILKRIKMTGQLPNNNYIRIAMVHGYQYLGKLKKLREDVSRFALRFL